MESTSMNKILVEGKTCWKLVNTKRLAFLIDAAAYFDAVATALEQARHSVMILGWDTHSQLELRHENLSTTYPNRLGDLLHVILNQQKDLNIYISSWDYASIFAFERELSSIFTRKWKRHPRFHFKYDNKHPVGASHHQKIVVIDDKIAFLGGLDLCTHRWDTPQHLVHDIRRRDPKGKRYPPFHDIQVMVDGEAAARLGDLARERWRRLSKQTLTPPPQTAEDPWPKQVKPDIANIAIGISRTEPAYADHSEVREVENLYLESIQAAKEFIYIENQYFTSNKIVTALKERLSEPDCPEVLIIFPYSFVNWISEQTMGVLRKHALTSLREADIHHHLSVYYAVNENQTINVHSKVMVVDDRYLRIGSSNINNRSMGLDTECDISIESGEDTHIQEHILAFRHRLLSEHLGTSPEQIQQSYEETHSVSSTIKSNLGNVRTLRPYTSRRIPPVLKYYVRASEILDPEIPLDTPHETIAERLVPKEIYGFSKLSFLPADIFLLLLACLAALWHVTPIGEVLSSSPVTQWLPELKVHELKIPILFGMYLIGGLLRIPTSFFVMMTVYALGGLLGFLCSCAGLYISALCTYAIGHKAHPNVTYFIAGSSMKPLTRRLLKYGILTMVTVRMLPLTPFTVENLVAGYARIPLPIFTLGTAIGMLPGVIIMSIYTFLLVTVIENQTIFNTVLLFAFTGFCLLSLNRIRHWLSD